MGHLQRLIASLPAYFNKDPQGATAITVSFNLGATFSVKDMRLRSVVPQGSTALDISLRDITLTQLAAAINAVSGYTATVATGLGTIKAYALIEGPYDGSGGVSVGIPYFTSTNYQVIAPIAESFDELDTDWNSALQQTDLRYSTGVWLDRLGKLYGVTRTAGETDVFYGRRINQSVIAAKANNFGIASILLNALGVPATVVNTTIYTFTVTVIISDGSGNPYSTVAINGLINQYKAYGTIPLLIIQVSGAEVAPSTGDTDSLVDSVGSGSGQWGIPEFGTRPYG